MADFEGTKELNFDENVSLEELGRLRLENRDLQLAREKLVKKLDKKKNELEIEKTNAITFRQLIQELNRKVELLEREPIPVISPLRIDPGPGLTGEVVERLVVEKTGLESNLAEQKTEIETLKSEITSMNTKIVLTNQKLEIARGENARFEKLVPELKLELSKKENECKRLSMSTNNADETNETETLKTRLQDLSITNKHYLSQLQKKDLTIATTTNKFETEKQQILELSRLEIEKLKQNETSLNEQLIKVKRELNQKCSGLEDDKSVLEIQGDVLNGQIGELSEERERCKGRVVELETTLTDLQLQLQKLGEVQQNETATVQKYEQQITELTNQITILNNELTSVKDSALVRKQLITKLNQDIEVLETNKDTIQQRLNDETSETETLKTRVQDLSITNKHYLSQLQKKDLTIATTTNKFETEKQQILELSRLEIEKLKQNETNLNEQLKHSQDNEKTDQEILTLSTDNSQLLQQIAILEGDNAKLQEEFDSKPSKQELIAHVKAHTYDSPNASNFHQPLFHQQERNLMRPSSLQTLEGFPPQSHQGAFSPQRFPTDYPQGTNKGRAFPDPPIQEQRVLVNPTGLPAPRGFVGNYPPTAERSLEQPRLPLSPTHRPHMARGLSATQEEASGIPVSKVQSPLNLATEATKVILLWSKERPTLELKLTYLDNSQDVVNLIWTDKQLLYQGNGTLAVGKHYGSLLFPSSGNMVQVQPFEVVRKPMGMFQVKLKLNDPQFREPSAGATSGATKMDLTPEVILQANKTGKSSSKMTFRGTSIHVVKLKAFPNLTESYNKQVICPINKRSELGVLMCIAEIQTKVGFQKVLPKYAGIKLYNPVGNCDGAYKDKKYFECSPNCGIFVPIGDVYVPVP